MTTTPAVSTAQREPELLRQIVVVIGGSGLETARRARAQGADVILAGRNPDRLERAAAELGALSSAAFDATDPAALDRFFADLPETIDHVLVTGPGPDYARLADLDRVRAHRDFDAHVWLAVAVAQHAVGRVRPGGTLLFMGGTSGRGRGPGLSLIAAGTAALPALIATSRSKRRRSGPTSSPPGSSTRRCPRRCSATAWMRAATSSARRCPSGAWSVRPTSPALAMHIMTNTPLTGATYDIDGGQQLIPTSSG